MRLLIQSIGAIVDPTQNTYGGDSAYSGNNLEPGANRSYADLGYADLNNALLMGANLSGAWLYPADLNTAEDWPDATWTGAKYSLNATDNNGNPIADTHFAYYKGRAWRDAAGMVAVPEPKTALLLGFGLATIALRKRTRSLSPRPFSQRQS